MALTPKRERFCQQYMIDLNGTQAAIRAGYAESGAKQEASRLLTDADVMARIAELQSKVSARAECSADDVIGYLLASYKAATEAKQHSAAVRAAELLGKRHGMFIDVRKDVQPEITPDEVRARIKRMVYANPALVDISEVRAKRKEMLNDGS